MPRRERLAAMMNSLLCTIIILTALSPAQGHAMGPIEGRWKSRLGPVQLEYRHGMYVARMLEDNPLCDLNICSEIFRGRLGEDGILIGMRRTCLFPECRSQGGAWSFAMGLVSDNDNRLDIVGPAPRNKECQAREFGRHGVLIRQSLESIDCEKQWMERRLPALRSQIRDAKVKEEFAQIQKELDALFRKYPGHPELMYLQARLYLAEGSQESIDRAAEMFALAEDLLPGKRGACGLAMIHARAKNIAAGIEALRQCAEGGHLTCEELAEADYDPLRSHRQFREIRNMLECDAPNRPAGARSP